MSISEIDHIYDPKYFKQLDVKFDRQDEVLWLYMKPHGRSCFNPGLLRELKRYQQGLIKWKGQYISGKEVYPVKYEVLTSGINGVFNYGGDLDLFLRAIGDGDGEALLKYGLSCIDVVYPNAINYKLPISTISLVKGDALGGGLEAALSSSTVIAERGVQMGFPEILFGLFPGMGAYSLLVRRVSPAIAKRIITSGKVYTAEEFHEMGIVDELAEKGSGEKTVRSFILKHKRHHNGYTGIDRIIRQEHPLSYKEMARVVEIWVDAALNLKPKELRIMERLAKAQIQKKSRVNKNNNDANNMEYL